jgi:hypothetical protein
VYVDTLLLVVPSIRAQSPLTKTTAWIKLHFLQPALYYTLCPLFVSRFYLPPSQVERCKAAAVAKTLKASVASARTQQQQQPQQRGRHHIPEQQQQQGGGGGDPARTPGYNVAYVGNIAFEARPEDISELFEACNVTKVC